MRIHYQTLEPVTPQELGRLRALVKRLNAGRRGGARLKLWKKSDILDCLEPREALWGFIRASNKCERAFVLQALKQLSLVAPRLTWVIYDENGRKQEVLLKEGKLLGGACVLAARGGSRESG